MEREAEIGTPTSAQEEEVEFETRRSLSDLFVCRTPGGNPREKDWKKEKKAERNQVLYKSSLKTVVENTKHCALLNVLAFFFPSF